MQSILPFIPLFFAWFLALLSPGPDFIMAVRNSMISRKSGIFTSIGLGLGMLTHVTYCLLGIAFLISQSILLFNFLKILAALYLIYIGWQSWRSKGSGHVEINREQKALQPFQAVRIGFLTNVLNPKVTLFFLGLFTLGITPETPLLHQIIFGLVLGGGTVAWFSLVALFFSTKRMQNIFEKFSKTIHRVFGALLIALGIKIAFTQK